MHPKTDRDGSSCIINNKGTADGGALSPQAPVDETKKNITQAKQTVDLPLIVQYCPANPCITRIIHLVHMKILDGVQDADVELNRYLPICSMLIKAADSPESSSAAAAAQCTGHGSVTLDCMCGRVSHQIGLKKESYMQQFKLGRICTFVQKRVINKVANQRQPLHILIGCLIPPMEKAPQYNLLPDLGRCFHAMLTRKYMMDQHKKGWIKAASNIQMLGGYVALPASSSLSSETGKANGEHASLGKGNSANAPGNAAAAASTSAGVTWGRMNLLCTALIQDSIPCLRRSKRWVDLYCIEMQACLVLLHTLSQ